MCNRYRRIGMLAFATLVFSACELIIAASPSLALGNLPVPHIPDTPAGHALGSWLDAFNSSDSRRIEAFARIHYPWNDPDAMIALRARNGGYTLLSIDNGGKFWITFHAQEKTGGARITGSLVVEPSNPELISHLLLAPAASDSGKIALTAVERNRVLESAAKLLNELYVFPEIGKRLSAALRRDEKRDTYRAIADGRIFAWRLSDDLSAIAHDSHLRVHFSQQVMPSVEPDRGAVTERAVRHDVLSRNCGFEKVEHLAPNIGYLKFDEFADPDVCAPTAAAAMNFVANSDALIIDLRDNHGGGPMVQFIASYLFAGPTHLNDIYWRRDNAVTEAWTLPYVPGKKFIGKPVFVLTSKRTFSAAEDFSYALKNLKRATLIGETTGGGAHPIEVDRIDDHYSIVVPVGRSISPITHTDWEGTGVEPDIKVPAADALIEALKRARTVMIKSGASSMEHRHPPIATSVAGKQ
jgi:hypothetical protein